MEVQNWRLADVYGQWRQEDVLSKGQMLKKELESGINDRFIHDPQQNDWSKY